MSPPKFHPSRPVIQWKPGNSSMKPHIGELHERSRSYHCDLFSNRRLVARWRFDLRSPPPVTCETNGVTRHLSRRPFEFIEGLTRLRNVKPNPKSQISHFIYPLTQDGNSLRILFSFRMPLCVVFSSDAAKPITSPRCAGACWYCIDSGDTLIPCSCAFAATIRSSWPQ